MTSTQRTTSIALGLAVILLSAGTALAVQQMRSSSSMSPVSPAKAETTDNATMFTLADVSAHKDKTSCWTVVNGSVYDLTSWIAQHPGGEQMILGLCGTDGSAAFNAQHGGQAQPATELARFKIGALK